MMTQARKASNMIQVVTKPPPILDTSERHCYNSMRGGEVYADEAYKDNKVIVIDKNFMDHSKKPLETGDFDANRYMNHE